MTLACIDFRYLTYQVFLSLKVSQATATIHLVPGMSALELSAHFPSLCSVLCGAKGKTPKTSCNRLIWRQHQEEGGCHSVPLDQGLSLLSCLWKASEESGTLCFGLAPLFLMLPGLVLESRAPKFCPKSPQELLRCRSGYIRLHMSECYPRRTLGSLCITVLDLVSCTAHGEAGSGILFPNTQRIVV